jgi:hypothetical protein
VHRTIWDALLSPQAPDEKWNGETWKNVGRSQAALEREIPVGKGIGHDAFWYLSQRYVPRRMFYSMLGSHSNAGWLKAKITKQFRGFLVPRNGALLPHAEDALSKVCNSMILLDFFKHFSPRPILLQWGDPSTGKLHVFPAKLRGNDDSEMEGDFFHWEHRHETIEGFKVGMITKPALRICDDLQPGTRFTSLYLTHANTLTILKPLGVLVDCDREMLDENETCSSDDVLIKLFGDSR